MPATLTFSNSRILMSCSRNGFSSFGRAPPCDVVNLLIKGDPLSAKLPLDGLLKCSVGEVEYAA